MTTREPTPKIVSEVCSLCGLDWKLHGKKPTTETCIGLLLDEVRALNARLAVRPAPLPIYPYPQPFRPVSPIWVTNSNNTTSSPLRPMMNNSAPHPVVSGQR